MRQRIHKVEVVTAPQLGITALELVSNHSFPRHTHDEHGIGTVISGGQRSWSGLGQVESLPGDVITVNPGEVHDGHPIDGAPRHWRIIYFDQRSPLFAADTPGAIEFTSPSMRDRTLAHQVNLLFDRLTQEDDRLGLEESVAVLLPRLTRLVGASLNPARACSSHVKMARKRIDDDPASPISLVELARLSGLSRTQIIRAFAREFGTTPYAYVIQCRVKLARQLIAKGRTPADAAVQAGFADQSHMSRAFARQFGLPPGRLLSA